MKRLIQKALAFDRLAVADLVALFEDARPTAARRRREALALLAAHPRQRRGFVAGFTGAPGSGKSALIGRVAARLVAQTELSVGVIAVDPSSVASGGALLGDRVRARLPHDEPRLYFRSQSSECELGGLGPDTFQVCRLLRRLFDVVMVETVGIGQSELDVRWLADRLYLVLQPLAGDELQVLKAGIMEVPDAVVVTKCDEEKAAQRLLLQLASALPLSRPFGEAAPALLRTSAETGEGIDTLVADLLASLERPAGDFGAKEAHFFRRWVGREWGRFGERVLRSLGGAQGFLAQAGGFDAAEELFGAAVRQALGAGLPAGAEGEPGQAG